MLGPQWWTAVMVRDTRALGDMVCCLTPYGARAQDCRTQAAHPLQGGQGCRSNQPLIPLEPHVQYGNDRRTLHYHGVYCTFVQYTSLIDIAQFLAVCSAQILEETLDYAA